MKHELCCIGHITLDKVVTPGNTVYMPGGTSFYVSHALKRFDDLDYALVTAVGVSERGVTDELTALGIRTTVLPSPYSVYFENIYGDNPDDRTQRVLAKAAPFTIEPLRDADAEIFHLGALLADDFPLETLRYLAGKGLISVDSQGYLREVRDTHVHATDWTDKHEAFRSIHFLKANEQEMEVLTGYKDAPRAAKKLYEWGIKEVLLTFGSMGSLIYDGCKFYRIPAYIPRKVVDPTGCGDTYMAGYLYRRTKGATIDEAGNFAAALSTLKIERSGPVDASVEDVKRVMRENATCMPNIDGGIDSYN